MRKGVLYIIDNDDIFTYGLRLLVTKNDLCSKVKSFDNAETPLDLLKRNEFTTENPLPDIVLLDINMPVMDGWDFLEEYIKLKPKLNKEITIHILSSSINPADIEKSKTYADVSGYLIKPIKIEILAEICSNIYS